MHTPYVDFSIAGSIIKRAYLDPANRAIIFEGNEQTYSEFATRILKMAQVLRSGGVCEGDRVGFLGLNHPAALEVMMATLAIGAIYVPMNFRLTGAELQYIIKDAGIHTYIADATCAPVIDSIRNSLPCHRYIATQPGPDAQRWESMQSLMDAAAPLAGHLPQTEGDVAVIMYTSGTTGRPKGAMLTHGNLMWNNLQAAIMAMSQEGDITLVAAPMFHIGGLNVTTISALQAGCCLLIHKGFDPALSLSDIAKYKVTTMFGAPAMFLFMAQLPQFADTDLSSVRSLIVGAAPVPKSLMEIYGSRGIKLSQGYGLTETSPMVSFLMDQYIGDKLGSAGKPGMFGEIRVINARGESVGVGEVGEIVYRGPNVMKGYWNRPEATAEAIDEKGWFHTGDAGYLDKDGFLFISDRVKDMVISGGENVYPAEVESVLYEHPAIAEVAVIGLPDEKWGEAVTAVVALHAEAILTLESLRDFATDRLARYKLPLRLHVMDALPRNPAGKVLKFKLREEFGQNK